MKTKTKAQLRIEIARDVLKHIKAKNITVKSGNYFIPVVKNNARYEDKQLQEVLPKLKECRVCALGGMFYAFVDKYNNFEISSLGVEYSSQYRDSKIRELLDMFSKDQLYLIECAFEETDISDNCRYRSQYKASEYHIAKAFRKANGIEGHEHDKALILIMKNIIRNKGTFKP